MPITKHEHRTIKSGDHTQEIIASEFAERLSSQHPHLLPRPVTRRVLKPFINFVLRQLTRSRVLATPIMEDSPDVNNRILPESQVDAISVRYSITPLTALA